MLSQLALALLAAARSPAAAPPVSHTLSAERVAWVLTRSAADRPKISIWTSREDPYHRGDRARVYFSVDANAYVTIVRVDTDGRIRPLFPEDPWDDNFARAGRTFEVLSHSQDHAFAVDDYPGVGYLLAVASFDPFDYDDLVRGDNWDYRTVSEGRVRGDPYVVLTDLASRISDGNDYDYDIAQYDVEQHYDYPRFLCYDCHAYTSYASWNPYDTYCSRFRIEIYDDDAYYPYRYYGSRRVVVTHPARLEPRYVFKAYDGRGEHVTRVRERPRDPEGRPLTDRGTGGRTGERGSIPVPVSPRPRREAEQPSQDREPPAPNQPAEPRRRPAPTPTDDPAVQNPTPAAREDRREHPSARQPDGGQTRERAEPRRETPPPRAEPRPTPPKVEPPPPKPAPPPKSTGEPQLRRRKP